MMLRDLVVQVDVWAIAIVGVWEELGNNNRVDIGTKSLGLPFQKQT